MTLTHSPLRYPGGKSSLRDMVRTLLRRNMLDRGHYAEPYAGGGSLALALLFGGDVSEIHLNDIDLSIWSFWNAVLNDTNELVDLIEKTPVTIEEWLRQREIHRTPTATSSLELGFSAFFLNRTNRSGIIKNAGVIGGLEQEGNYKIDCRFNKEELTRRIRRIAKYNSQIHLHRLDALDFLDEIEQSLPSDTFCCIDPPYFNKGSSLYTNFYTRDDHEYVANRILKLKCPWIVTYDNTEEIRKLYSPRRQFELSLNYSVQTKRVGSELLVASKGLLIPEAVKSKQICHSRHRAA